MISRLRVARPVEAREEGGGEDEDEDEKDADEEDEDEGEKEGGERAFVDREEAPG